MILIEPKFGGVFFFFFFTVCGLDQSQQQIHQLIFIKSEIHL